MLKRTLLEASKHLHSHALESFISDASAEQQNHNFQELSLHPNINTISKQYQALIKLYSHFNYQYYLQHLKQFPPLKPKQIKTLKIISLLSILEGQNFVKTQYLLKSLQLNEDELIDFLLQLSIIGTITIRIDEEERKVWVLNAEPRNNIIVQQRNNLMKTKINMLIQKNKNIQNEINYLKKKIQDNNK